MIVREQASRLRQGIAFKLQRLIGLLEVVKERTHILPGSVYRRGRRCGKRGCRCCRGELHMSLVLTVQKDGKSRWVSLEGLDKEKVQQLVRDWRRFRMVRSEMLHTFRDLLSEVDQLGRMRQVDLRDLDHKERE